MSKDRDPDTDQPIPEVNDRPFIQDLVVDDVEDRKQFGINKYGTALQSGNGRDMLRDAYEEALDLVIYLRGMIDEDHHILLELQRVRADRSRLMNWMQEKAAPLQYSSMGTPDSAIYNLGSYIDRLKIMLQYADEAVGDHCQSHATYEAGCATCDYLTRRREIAT